LVDVSNTTPDHFPDFAGGDALTTTNDSFVGEGLLFINLGRLDPSLLNPDSRSAFGDVFIHPDLNQKCSRILFFNLDSFNREITQNRVPFVGNRNQLALFYLIPPDLVGKRYQGNIRVLTKIDQGNGQSRTHDHAVSAGGACRSIRHKWQTGDPVFFRMDNPGLAD
jgi:hypothetical protein